MEEQEDFMRQLWTSPVNDFSGKYHRVDRGGIVPLPNRQIPVWFGGSAEASVRRAARMGDGYIFGNTGERIQNALAILRDPSIVPLIKNVVSMGGTIHAPGNATPSSEYNVFCDPHAFDVVIRAGLKFTLVPLDVTYECLFQKRHMDRIQSKNAAVRKFIDDSTRFYMEFHDEYQSIEGCAINDPLAAAILIKPDLVQYADYHVTVELKGDHNVAKTSADHFKATGKAANSKVAMKVNAEAFMDFFIERVNTL
jgi:purine nucleosidase